MKGNSFYFFLNQGVKLINLCEILGRMVKSETGGMIRVRQAGWVRENGIWVQRLYVGKRVSVNLRTVHPHMPVLGDVQPITGSIGFLDFLVQHVYDHSYSSTQMESAVEILRVGIEPAYHGQGYGLAMVEVLAERARDYSISFLVAEDNSPDRFPHLRSMEQLGFVAEPRFSRGVTIGKLDSPRFTFYAEISNAGHVLKIPEQP